MGASAEAIRIARSAVAEMNILGGAESIETRQDERPTAPLQDEYPESADGLPDHELANGTAAPGPLTLVRPSAWRGVPIPPMHWLATNRIPAGDVTILSGDGGSGKTTIAKQLAVAVAGDLPDWLGTTCETGPVIFFSGEEPQDEMRRRLERVAGKRGLEAADLEQLHFHFADPDKCLLAVSQAGGTMAPTPLFESLCASAKDIRPALIVVDSIAATFGGNQNDRVSARTFVGLFRRLARQTGCAILLLDHPSLSGITSGTGRAGSMDWQNATRARLHLETENDDEGSGGRTLEVKKLNYGPAGEKVKLRWEDGCFVMQGETPAPQQAAAFNAADRAYLACLDRLTEQGREVREHRGRDMPRASSPTCPRPRASRLAVSPPRKPASSPPT